MTPRGSEQKKVLAIAVTREGKVINKLIPGQEPVKLGTDYNNNIMVEGDNLPGSMVLISTGPARDTYILRLTEDMNAKITSPDGTTLEFSDLRELGVFQVEDGCYLWSFKYGDQGQVNFGTYTIHFGYIEPPKPPEKPEKKSEKPDITVQEKVEEPEEKDDRILKLIITVAGRDTEIFPNAGIATIGEADYNTVSVKNAGLPRIHTILEPDNNKYRLSLPPEIKGGVSVGGNILPFKTLIERNLLKRENSDEPYCWIFDKNVSGVFVVGSTEISFSFIKAPPKEEKPKPKPVIEKKKFIPSAYNWDKFASRPHDALVCKGSVKEESKFQIIIGFGIAASLIMGAVCDRLVVVPEETITEILRRAPSARVASLAQTPQSTEGVGEEIIGDLPEAEVVSTGVGSGGGGPAGSGDGSPGISAGTEAASGVLQDIGFAAYGTGSTGGGAGFMGDLQDAAGSGLGLHSGTTGEGLMAGSGGGGSGGISGLVGSGGGVAETAETVASGDIAATHRAAQVTVTASASGTAIELGFRNISDIRRRLGVLKMRVQTAYEGLLRSNPTAGGVINVGFYITPSGAVTGVSVSAPSQLSGLTATVQSAASSLNFGPAEGQTDNLWVEVPVNLLPPE